ncbi:MAG: TVP38/TMEM64 family protein [Clostridia bacterium]|nr:TVP38/TMEM64 family protein [Clostridia bacterium]
MTENGRCELFKFLKKLLISALVIGAIVVGAYLLLRHLGLTDLTSEAIREYVDSTGVWAPIVFIIISFLQVTFVPIPGAVTIVAGYLCFGFWESFLYSYVGMMLGAVVAYLLGRWIGRPFVVWLAGGEDKVDYWLKKLKGRENLLLFFMFFLPLFPDDLLCSVAGIIPQKPLTFTLMQLVTRTTSIGATLISTTIALQGWPFAVLIAVGALVLIPLFIWCYKNIERVNDFFSRVISRIFRRRKNEENKE